MQLSVPRIKISLYKVQINDRYKFTESAYSKQIRDPYHIIFNNFKMVLLVKNVLVDSNCDKEKKQLNIVSVTVDFCIN